MFLLIKELVSRLIEFITSEARGSSREEKQSNALRSSIFLSAVLGAILVWLSVNHIDLLITTRDLENSLARVSTLFDDEGENSLSTFVKINNKLSEELNSTKLENLLLVKGVVQLTEELKWANNRIVSMGEVNDSLSEDYQNLLESCLTVIKDEEDD